MDEEIIEALENSAGNRKDRGRIGDPATGDHADIILWRNHLMRFFEDLDGDLTVDEIRRTLEDYN